MAKDDAYQEFVDGIVTLENGMDSGVLPFLLPRNKLSFATNCTVRGGFITHRPVLQQIAVTFPSALIETAAESGTWQNACYYKPDFGAETICAAIGGRLFEFTPAISGYAATVKEITIPGDPNPPTISLNWMWQAERWLIWNDGLDLPVFFDGTNSRRSMGDAHILATTAAPFTVPATFSTVSVTLTAPYSGPINIPVTIQGFRYNIVPDPTVTNAKLTKLYDLRATVPTDSQVVVIPSQVAVLLGNLSGLSSSIIVPVSFPSSGSGSTPFDPSSGTVTIGADEYRVNAVVNAGTWNLSLVPTRPPSSPHPAGSLVTTFSTKLNVVVGQTVAPFTVPAAVGGTVNIQLDSAYIGSPQVVWIGTGEYLIESVPPAPPSANITLQNIGASYVPVNVIASGNQLISLPELPAGRAGAYGMGRNWESLTDGIQFLASDIVGGPSGTPAFDYRDAVLRTTEMALYNGGGYFHVPGTVSSIRSMTFTANLDASLGQGALQVGTPTTMFSCNAGVDRTKWTSTTDPILSESLIGFGPLAQNSTIPVNSDTLFRSVVGIGSLILGRREFYSWGNTPISNEIERIVSRDSTSLLIYSSAISFDNRMLMTCQPTPTGLGVSHQGSIALDYEPISNMQQKLPPVYDGLWTGVSVLQWVTGLFNGVQRAFAFTLNGTTGKIELYELLMTNAGKFDNGNNRITWSFETATLFKDVKGKSIFDLIRLQDGEIYVDDIVGLVNFQTYYRPDNYPCWIPWHSWSVCSQQPSPAIPNAQPTYRTRMGLGTPDPSVCEPANGRTMVEGYTFQFKMTITGHCRFRGMKVRATLAPQTRFAQTICKDTCEELPTATDCQPCGLIDCLNPDDFGTYVVQNNLSPVQPTGLPFLNQQVVFVNLCEPGWFLQYNGTLPAWITLDVDNSQLVGAAGQFQGFSQSDANQIAQAALDSFSNAALAAGTLLCNSNSS